MDDFETDEIRSLERRRDELAHLLLQHDGEKSSDEIRIGLIEEELREIEWRLESLRPHGTDLAEELRRSNEDDLLRQERIR